MCLYSSYYLIKKSLEAQRSDLHTYKHVYICHWFEHYKTLYRMFPFYYFTVTVLLYLKLFASPLTPIHLLILPLKRIIFFGPGISEILKSDLFSGNVQEE